MNLICPHCQKMLSVPDQNAGQTATCPFCGQSFQVPALPQTTAPVFADLPADIPLVPEPPAPQPSPPPLPASQPAREEEVYRVAAEPPMPSPPPPPPRREERVKVSPPPQPSPIPQQAVRPPPSAPPTGYVHTRTIWISPVVVPWVNLGAFILLFVLLFFAWTGAYPGGYGVYTQSAFQAIFGSYSTDPVGEKVLNMDQEIRVNIRANWVLMGLYFLLVLATVILAAAPKIVSAASLQLPPPIQHYWPWRPALLTAAAGLTFLILLIQFAAGFGLEKAITSTVAANLEKERAEATTAEEKEKIDIKEGLALGRFNPHRKGRLWLAVILNLVGFVGVLLENWLAKRGPRPLPRIEIQW